VTPLDVKGERVVNDKGQLHAAFLGKARMVCNEKEAVTEEAVELGPWIRGAGLKRQFFATIALRVEGLRKRTKNKLLEGKLSRGIWEELIKTRAGSQEQKAPLQAKPRRKHRGGTE